MEKLGFSSMRSLNQLRSSLAPPKSFQLSSRPSSDPITMGSFTNLKLTAEKLMKEQASVKTDLEMANSKLKKSTERISSLEEKLQNAINENAKLKVKQSEDAKLWKGLESKFSSTKALCDQFTETLQQLASQARDAEQDKRVFEERLSASSVAFDNLQLQFSGLSLKLKSVEQNIKQREQQLIELRTEKEENGKAYMDEHNRTSILIEEKDSLIKDLEGSVAADKMRIESLTSRLGELQHDLCMKADICQQLRMTQDNLEKEKHTLQSNNNEYSKRLVESSQEIKTLEDSIHFLLKKSVELDRHSLAVSDHVAQLNSMFDTCFKLVQQEKELTVKRAQCHFDELHGRFLHVMTENGGYRSDIEVLKGRITELQKTQEGLMVQHAEECHSAEEKIRSLESESELLSSKKAALDLQVVKLQENIRDISDTSNQSETKVQDLILKISKLEAESQETKEQLQIRLQGKSEEVEVLQKEILGHKDLIDSLGKEVSQFRDRLEEKEQLHIQFKDKERQLEDQRKEIQASLDAAENKLIEAKKQYDLMQENKQMELMKHFKEISLRNDQAINDIRRKFELEKVEILNLEKEKAEKRVLEMDRNCQKTLAESIEESKQKLVHVQEEHACMIKCIQQEHDKKVSDLRAEYNEELKVVRVEAEDELREKIMLLRKEHEGQIRDLEHQHENEYQKLQEELELQKSKEERQRALLQLQWKVMDGNPQEDQEVNSKKVHSVSSSKNRYSDSKNRTQPTLRRTGNDVETSAFIRATQTPVPNLLKKVDKGDPGGIVTMPKHSRKITHHQYEVETSNGKTITKRRKTKSTVMFEDPAKHKRLPTPRSRANKGTPKVAKGGGQTRPSNIGDLFSEGSLNPYTDDPYAFD